MKVKVILLQDVSDLGDKDDVVEVAEGHARNLLIPKGLGVMATSEQLRALKERTAAVIRAAEAELHHLQVLAEQLDGLELMMNAKVSEGGTLYAAVTVQKIVDALLLQKYIIQPSWIVLPEAIKSIGEYDIQFHLPHGLEAKIIVTIAPLSV